MVIDHGQATDAGPRSENQDRCAASPAWAVVSDGMGGHAGGSLAADLTCRAAIDALQAAEGVRAGTVIARAHAAANDAVRTARDADPAVADMGATLTIALAVSVEPGRSRWLVGSLGDSPAWWVGTVGARQVTIDHTVAAAMARSGTLDADQAADHPGRHLLMRAIGIADTAEPDLVTVDLGPGDTLVLASDGVSGVLDPTGIADVLSRAGDAAAMARGLVVASLDAGTSDNVTAVVLRHPDPSAHAE